MSLIRVLHINGGIMDYGGISSFMMNYYRSIDRTKVQFDFLVHGFEKGVHDVEIVELGGKIYNVPIKSKDYFGNIRALKEIFMSGLYSIVHCHMDAMNTFVLRIAKKCGVPIRISHCHNTEHLTNNFLRYHINEFARRNSVKFATHRFACSELAGNWLFGAECEFNIANNAILVDKFNFNSEKRVRYRDELKIGTSIAIGHIGRFDYQKNHSFLIDVFFEIMKESNKYKLLLVGEGYLKKDILEKAESLNLKDHIIFLGERRDISELISAFDIFVLPSLFEGLPVVGVEAQANGLACVFSSNVSKEIALADNVVFISINCAQEWAKKIMDLDYLRLDSSEKIKRLGYDIHFEAGKLGLFYQEVSDI